MSDGITTDYYSKNDEGNILHFGKTLVEKYLLSIKYYSHKDNKWKKGFAEETRKSLLNSAKFRDIVLRECIGKTEDIRIALCSHQAIINNEFPNHFCRVCNTDLSVGDKVRYNDFLILRHPQCFKPICLNCAKNNPDKFHIAFKKGLDKYMKIGHDGRIMVHLNMELKQYVKQITLNLKGVNTKTY